MRPIQLNKFLTFAIAHQLPVLIKGKPGIGKSDITEQSCADAGAKLIISHPVVSDPTDYKGMPFASAGEAHFLPFGDLKTLIDTKEPTVYFLDDLGQATPAVQAACMQLLLARRINGFKVSDTVTFLAATNRKEDKAGVSGMLEPVKSRFVSIVDLEVDHNDWCRWAIEKGNMPTELIAFIRFRPELIDQFEPTRDMTNTPSPRTVAHIGKLQNAGLDPSMYFEVFTGAAGRAFAAEYTGFLDLYKNMPNIDQILLNPDGAPIPEEPGILYAVSGALASRITEVNADAAFTYIERLPTEIGVACAKDTAMRNNKVLSTRAYTKWAVKNGNMII